MTRIVATKVLGFRVRRHSLDRRAPAGSLVPVARALCGVHAQLAAPAELAFWARVAGLRRDEVREALEQERSLVKTWAMRGTLHLLAADDLALYVAVLGPRWDDPGGAWLRGFGLTKKQYDPILENVPRALGARPQTREQLAELAGPALRERILEGLGSLLKPSARRGDLCFGPNRGRNVTFVRPGRWLRGFRRVDGDEARHELVNGRAAGIWERERRAGRLEVRIEPLARLGAAIRRAIAEEADRLGEFLDAPAELQVAA
jgi:hypothetical protein